MAAIHRRARFPAFVAGARKHRHNMLHAFVPVLFICSTKRDSGVFTCPDVAAAHSISRFVRTDVHHLLGFDAARPRSISILVEGLNEE